MLSVVATLIIVLSDIIVFFIDESDTAFAINFVVLLCACAITLHSDYSKDDNDTLQRLKYYCIISMALICCQLSIAGFRFQKYYDQGHRIAIITLFNFMVAELFLVYSLTCTIATLEKTNERRPLRKQPTSNSLN